MVSTVVLVVAMAAARFLPLTARTRYAVLLVGIVKFAVPTAVFRFIAAEAVPAPLRILGAGTNAVAAQTATRIDWIPIAWAAIALVLMVRWLLLRTRTVASALRSSTPASMRELAAVRDARSTMRIRMAVDTTRSPICEAPAVVRIIRPVLILPGHGCDDLTDDELRSLVLHECAHVARYDNLAAFAQALATSLLWFHPLVWLASRELTIAREEACDEAVADSMRDTDAYVSALTKVCRAIVAPRTAGASCMASAKIKERMEHLMSYETIRMKAWSHRAMLIVAVLLIAISTFAATSTPKTRPYSLTFNVTLSAPNQITFDATLVDNATNAIVSQPRLTTHGGIQGSVSTKLHDGREISMRMRGQTPGEAEILLEVMESGKLVQRTLYTQTDKTYDGEPISLNLKDADIRDVLSTLGDLTGLTFDVAPDVSGSIDMNVKDVPWDKMLDDLLTDHGLVAEIDGSTVRVKRK
jgi:beta-lactamase regulating signal transducer with metallopeptidase domain